MHPVVTDPTKRGILIVDDDYSARQATGFILGDSGYTELFMAESGDEALSKCRELGPALYLIILDLRMPGMDGLTFFRHLTNCSDYPVGVVVVTGYGSHETKNEFSAMSSGNAVALNYISKPFDVLQFKDSVSRALDTVHARRLTVLDYKGNAIFSEISLLHKRISALADQQTALTERLQSTVTSIRDHQDSAITTIEYLRDEFGSVKISRRSLATELGIEVLKTAILAIAVLGMLRLGLGDILGEILGSKK